MRILLWLTLGLAAACGLMAWLIRGPVLWMLGAGLLVLGLGLGFWRKGRPLALVLLGCGLGLFWCCRFDRMTLRPMQALDGQELVLSVEADGFGWEGERGTVFRGRALLQGRERQIQVYLKEQMEIRPGDRIEGRVKLRCTDGQRPTYHRGNGIFLLAYAKGGVQRYPGRPSLRQLPQLLRQGCLEGVGQAFPEDVQGFAKALLLGDKTGLSYESRTDLRVTGVSHMAAVSGLHLSILFLLCYTLMGKGRFSTPVLGIPVVWIFAAMVGFTPSVTRAALMETLLMLSMAVNREYDPATALSVAAGAMLLHDPMVMTSVGFQLSVCSVAGIFLFYGPMSRWVWAHLPPLDQRQKLRRWVRGSVVLTLSATALSAPLAACYFGSLPLIGVLTNLLVIPLLPVIFYGILLICALWGILPSLAGWVGRIVAWPIRWVLWLCHMLGKFPLASVYLSSPYVKIWLGFGLVLMAYLILIPRPKVVWTALAAGLGLCLALGCSYAEPLLDEYRVEVLDVGQGQCVILQAEGHTFLVDCGGSYDEQTADLAAETLLGQGIRSIDGLIISHYDRDHCGAAEYLAQRIEIGHAYLPVVQKETALSSRVIEGLSRSEIHWLTEDVTLSLGESRLTLFVPQMGKTDNESSVAVLFQRGKYDTLILGDLPISGELALMERTALPDLEVLVVGHHGSRSSTAQALLAQTAPDAAMISVGRHNFYGHPAAEVLRRLEQAGCTVFRTDRMGSILYRR